MVWKFIPAFVFFLFEISVTAQQVSKLEESKKAEIEYTLVEATRQYLFGNLKEAKFLYTKCIEADPSCDAAYFVLSQLDMASDDEERALANAEKAYRLKEKNEVYRENLADIALSAGKLEKAVELLRIIVEKNQEPSYRIKLVRALEALGEKKKAMLEIEKFSIPVNLTCTPEYIRLLQNAGKNKEALYLLKMLFYENKENTEIANDYAVMCLRTGNNKEAEEVFRELIKNTEEPDQAGFNAFRFFVYSKDSLESDRIYNKFLKDSLISSEDLSFIAAAINDPPVFSLYRDRLLSDMLSETFVQPANRELCELLVEGYNKAGKNAEAVKLLDSCLVRWDADEKFLNQLVYTFSISGNTVELEKAAGKAMGLYPSNPAFGAVYGLGLMGNGKNQEAAEIFGSLLERRADENAGTQVEIFLAEVYRNLGRHKESDSLFNIIIKKDPGNLLVLNNYSYYLAERNENLKLAYKLSSTVIEKASGNSTYLDTYAWVLFKMKKYSSAEKYMRRAIELRKEESDVLYEHYGDILFKLGKREQAEIYWNKASTVRKNAVDIPKRIEELEHK